MNDLGGSLNVSALCDLSASLSPLVRDSRLHLGREIAEVSERILKMTGLNESASKYRAQVGRHATEYPTPISM